MSSLAASVPPTQTASDFLDKAWPTASILIADESNTDIPMEQAFQDSVNLFDLSGPLGTILIATGAAFAVLILLKWLENQMDAAIEKLKRVRSWDKKLHIWRSMSKAEAALDKYTNRVLNRKPEII